jgi:3-phenylpropionate/trans-cinnamate dioxygenase ferredoxin reductase component
MSETFVIIGAGLAGAKAAEALREKGFDGQLLLFGQERHRPYERPALSKGYLAGSAERESVFVHPAGWYDDNHVELRLDTTVTAIDRPGKKLRLADGGEASYDKLVLATGARPRRLSVPGADASGVYELRTLDDSDSLVRLLAGAGRIVVIGAGWIGLEVTAAARAAGADVTVIESAELPLLNVLGPELAAVFQALHAEHQVDFRFGAQLAEITASDGIATGVRLADGTTVAADAVLVAIGAQPNTELAADSGLTVDNGIVVDEAMRTSDPDIFAVGDVASAFHPLFDKHLRVEHWANALKQPATAAAAMLGAQAGYRELPYFYTDQYDLGMEYLGHVEPGGYDEVVFRGDVPGREFIAFWLAGGRVLAGMNVNVWDVTDPIKALIQSGKQVDKAALADPGQPLESL